jgi:hypothetical protein
MSGQPFGDPNPNPYQTPPGAVPKTGMQGESPELMSRANSAFNLAIGGIAVSLCCCGIVGLIMGIMSMNNAGSVLALTAPGSEANAKASTAKILGIIAIVLGIVQMIGWSGVGVVNNMGR